MSVVRCGHLLDGGADGLERLAGALDGGGAVGGAPRAVLDDVDGVARVGLDRADERGDRAGGRARLLGELADLLGDDGEAAALLARARGLDGGVERQQVGLRGDRGDGLDDAADLLGLGAELADGGGGRRRGLAHGAPSRRSPRARRRRRRWPGRAPRSAATAVSCGAVGGLRRRARSTSATVSRAELDGAHLALGAGGDLARRRGRSRPRRGRSPRSRWPAGARPTTRRVAVSDTWPIMVGQRGARGVVGLHRGRGVVADLAHGLGHVADLVAGAPVGSAA